MADQAANFDQALEENVQRILRGLDAQCVETKQHFEDEREARIALLDSMYEELLAEFLLNTEVCICDSAWMHPLLCVIFLCTQSYAAIDVQVQRALCGHGAQEARGGPRQRRQPRICDAQLLEGLI